MDLYDTAARHRARHRCAALAALGVAVAAVALPGCSSDEGAAPTTTVVVYPTVKAAPAPERPGIPKGRKPPPQATDNSPSPGATARPLPAEVARALVGAEVLGAEPGDMVLSQQLVGDALSVAAGSQEPQLRAALSGSLVAAAVRSADVGGVQVTVRVAVFRRSEEAATVLQLLAAPTNSSLESVRTTGVTRETHSFSARTTEFLGARPSAVVQFAQGRVLVEVEVVGGTEPAAEAARVAAAQRAAL